QVGGLPAIDMAITRTALDRMGVDRAGLDEMDRRLLRILIEHFNGGPVGVETLGAALAEPRDTIEDVYEPFLLQRGLLSRTPRGRTVTRKAYEHVGIAPPKKSPGSGGDQGTLPL
ncbi:MAG: Holliday junction DNA helicase RuvB C-terminal domain-containing protein, partial [Polyangiales bacterium]